MGAARAPRFRTSCAVALTFATLGVLVQRWRGPPEERPAYQHWRSPPTMEWSVLKEQLPSVPTLVRGSPMQAWHSTNDSTVWRPQHIAHVAASTSAGGYQVRLNSHSSPRFTHHKDGADVPTEALHSTTVTTLRAALRALWPERGEQLPASGANYHYLSTNVEDLPVELASPVLSFLPEGCLHDVGWAAHVAAAVTGPRRGAFSEADALQAQGRLHAEGPDCSGLKANLWLGTTGVSTAAHFDREHNLFLQAYGSKRFTLLPPSVHRRLRLHPRWHGSRRQAQVHLPELAPSLTEDTVWVATLQAGDVLYLPPLWFHHVLSLSPNTALNFWVDSMPERAWHFLGRGRAELLRGRCDPHHSGPGDSNARLSATFGCVIAFAQSIIEEVEGLAPGRGRQHLAARGQAVVASRYAQADGDAQTPTPAREEMSRVASERSVARKAVLRLCEQARAARLAADELDDGQKALLGAYADALRALEAGTRDLLLDELVEALAEWAVGPAGADMGVELAPAAVGAFVEQCFGRAA